MQPTYLQTCLVQSTLAADNTNTFKASFGMTLDHVSLSNASANAGTLDIGEFTDSDGYKDGSAFGVGVYAGSFARGDCTELDSMDNTLSSGQYPHLDAKQKQSVERRAGCSRRSAGIIKFASCQGVRQGGD